MGLSIDKEKVIYDIERCICRVPDACRDCSHYQDDRLDCMEKLLADALALLKEQDEKLAMMRMIFGTDAKVVGEIVRCKNCKHRGEWEREEDIHGSYSHIVFPDGSRCPGQCEDQFYSWRPDDDWFCADGEPKTGLT